MPSLHILFQLLQRHIKGGGGGARETIPPLHIFFFFIILKDLRQNLVFNVHFI